MQNSTEGAAAPTPHTALSPGLQHLCPGRDGLGAPWQSSAEPCSTQLPVLDVIPLSQMRLHLCHAQAVAASHSQPWAREHQGTAQSHCQGDSTQHTALELCPGQGRQDLQTHTENKTPINECISVPTRCLSCCQHTLEETAPNPESFSGNEKLYSLCSISH